MEIEWNSRGATLCIMFCFYLQPQFQLAFSTYKYYKMTTLFETPCLTLQPTIERQSYRLLWCFHDSDLTEQNLNMTEMLK